MEELGLEDRLQIQLFQGKVTVRPPHKGKVALALVVHRGDGQGGGLGPHPYPGHIHPILLQHLDQAAAEPVGPYLPHKGDLGPQAGGGHRQIGTAAPGVGGKEGDALAVDPCLGQIDEHLADGNNLCHGEILSLPKGVNLLGFPFADIQEKPS